MFGLFKKPDDSAHSLVVAEQSARKWETEAGKHWKRFTDACKEANTIEDELTDALESNTRLADALAAKNARLEAIIARFENQKSGTARLAVKLARGE